jgi:putative pyoverdin transport system ATP-binding/permease protein
MQLLRLLSRISVLMLATAIGASVLSGFAAMAALICVFESLRSGNLLWWQFALAAAFAILIREFARLTLARLATKSVLRLRRRLVRSVLHVPLLDLERIGSARLLVAFTSDLSGVASAIRNLVSLFASSAFLLALVAYLGWLSPNRAVVTTILLLVCIVAAILLRRLETRQRHAARQAWDRVVYVYQMLLDGVKQLKINRQLARQVLRSFEERVHEQMQSGARQGRPFDVVGTWVQFMFYLILGVAVFGPFGDMDLLRRGYGYGLLALLHIRGPLRSLISDSRAFNEASVALKRITELGVTLSEDQEHDAAHHLPAAPGHWRRLDLQGVVFRYLTENGTDEFTLGPLDITLRPGEVVFIAGGNGSGKTTFAKLLTGLYPPSSGSIQLDDTKIGEESARWFRSKFSVVFADFCLFEGVADLRPAQVAKEAERLALRLKLDQWMLATAQSSGGSATLSSGERRRVALLMALLEDRPILVFDEWTADQDPQYKDIFYKEILPRIRDLGKLVVVISHDERYFHMADRVLWLERGKPPIWRPASSFPAAPEAMADTRNRTEGASELKT